MSISQQPNSNHFLDQIPEEQTSTPSEAPPELRAREQWVCWRYETRGGKPTKVPYSPRRGPDKHAKTTDPTTWCFYVEAVEAVEAGRYDGIGFVFAEDDPYAGIDLDHVRDPKTGAVAEWATEWVEAFGGFTELSPSGRGLHIIVRGQAPDRKNQKAGVEAYSSKRFFTFSGNTITDVREIPERQQVIDHLSKRYFPVNRHVAPEPKTGAERSPIDLADQDLLEKARNARKGSGERFRALYDRGEFLEHASHSEARMELLRSLAYWTAWDAPRMSKLYESSALHATPGYAKKWARLGEKECQRAIARQPRAYGQDARRAPRRGEGPGDGDTLATIIDTCRAMAAEMAWEGRGGPTDRAVYGSLLGIAAKYGTIAKKGVIFSADMRTVAVDAGTSLPTTHKSMHRLREERGLILLSKKSTSKKAAVYLLRYPNATQGFNTKQCVDYVKPLSNPLRQLRNPGPATDKEFDKNGRKIVQSNRHLLRRLGKLVALVVEGVALSGAGGITEFELARALERRPQNVRRVLVKALAAGLIVEGEDLRFRVPDDLEWRLDQELEESGCNDARERDARRYDEERRAFYTRRNRKADAAPSAEDLERERRQRVQDALDILQDNGTGPAIILQNYLKGETQTFEYVVNAVAYYYGSANSELWRQAVRDAVDLINGLGGGGR